MKVGVPSEIKVEEHRVAITPVGVRELVEDGHEVFIQKGAGLGSAITDADFESQGAKILPDAAAVFGEAELIVKVKEPQPSEVVLLEPRHTLFTSLHLAADGELARGLQKIGALCIAYETVQDEQGHLPLLAPMSEVAGRLATQAGAFILQKPLGGRGILLGGTPGVPPANVLVIGGGTVGYYAAKVAVGMGAKVAIFDRSIARLRELDIAFGGSVETIYSSTLAIEQRLPAADLVVGAVLVVGARTPHLISRKQLSLMPKHSVLVDVAIDQGGCFETSKPTTHTEPTYEVEGITHYCVANMPGAVPITSTYALTNATLPYTLDLANHGALACIAGDARFRSGVNVASGKITYAPVAEAIGETYVPVDDALRLGAAA